MKSPDIFVPKSRLELPFDVDDETKVVALMEHELIMLGFDALSLMRARFPLLPNWEEWDDGEGGVIQLVTSDTQDSEVVPTASVDERGNQLGASSTDGTIVHRDRPALITFDVIPADRATRKIFWGVTTHDPEMLLTLGSEVDFLAFETCSSWWNQYFEHFYPPTV